MADMKATSDCIDLICRFEGFRSRPYMCPAGVPTIGYGSTRYADGSLVSLDDAAISEPAARELLASTLGQYEDAVNRYVTVDLTASQFDALVSFAYNVGANNLRTSTLLRKLNLEGYSGAAAQFERWNRSGGRVLKGLVRRRKAERLLFERKA